MQGLGLVFASVALCLIKCSWQWDSFEFLHIRCQCYTTMWKNGLAYEIHVLLPLAAKLFSPHASVKVSVFFLSGKRFLLVASELVSSPVVTELSYCLQAKTLPHCWMSWHDRSLKRHSAMVLRSWKNSIFLITLLVHYPCSYGDINKNWMWESKKLYSENE